MVQTTRYVKNGKKTVREDRKKEADSSAASSQSKDGKSSASGKASGGES